MVRQRRGWVKNEAGFRRPRRVDSDAGTRSKTRVRKRKRRGWGRGGNRRNSRDDVVYEPKQMSAAELLAGYRYANGRFYSLTSTVKRLSRSSVQLWWTLPLNLAYGYQWRRGE